MRTTPAIATDAPFTMTVNGHVWRCRPNVEANLDAAIILYEAGEIIWTPGCDEEDIREMLLNVVRYSTSMAARTTLSRGVA